MTYNQTIIYFEGRAINPREDPLNERGLVSTELSDLLLCSKFQESLLQATKELHSLTERISQYRTPEVTQETVAFELPQMMRFLVDKREHARRVYREALRRKVSAEGWDLEDLFHELEEELFRSEEVLSLYPRRGTFH
ncbi:Gpg1p NDAI_0I01580 [Naumovozyma dairenensis CBS 421]|uniref:Uncharacterized protein n=1 Tax=Naumovozyma dairenensis (strain ATCC 10597 / BCRC 20456 / CBS 421 / NBRC 0211 / NRRL Y-12639) TaxID=1071378 RepID=G0WG16_NAUDC|nr:hypothetical protein NDAI_0I01580 [Naumovozyma dairenensis CBS 421]CCD26727.1 hypothetical protein NDAI_0I01580 [Naumovozyma dairenensis CBS 421]